MEDIMIPRGTMMLRSIGFGVFTGVAMLCQAGQGGAVEAAKPAERFEVTSIKAVRPALVDTVAALQRRDIAGAKAAFQTYDSLWNGIEMYINTRSRPMYEALEIVLQAKITKALDAPNADAAAILMDAQ